MKFFQRDFVTAVACLTLGAGCCTSPDSSAQNGDSRARVESTSAAVEAPLSDTVTEKTVVHEKTAAELLPPPSATALPEGVEAEVVMVNEAKRFAVLDFPPDATPPLDAELSVYRGDE